LLLNFNKLEGLIVSRWAFVGVVWSYIACLGL